MLKKREVVMLPTNEKAKEGMLCLMKHRLGTYRLNTIVAIAQQRDGLKAWVNAGHLVALDNKICLSENFPYISYQHLYFLSDEEIKEGDWYYTPIKRSIEQCVKKILVIKDVKNDIQQLKIIATTDNSLHTGFAKTLCPKCNSKMSIHLPDHIKCINCGQEGWNLVQGVYNEINKLPQPSLGFINEFVAHYNAKSPITHVMVEYDSHFPDTDGDFGKLKVNLRDNIITIRKVKDSWTREEVIALCKSARDSVGVIEFEKWVNQNL